MRRETQPTEDDILNLLKELRGTASPREMAQALGKRHSARRALPKLLQRLKRKGLIEEVRPDRFRLASPKSAKHGGQPGARPPERGAQERRAPERGAPDRGAPAQREVSAAAKFSANDPQVIVGRLVAHRDGYGFVVPEKPRTDLDGDLFIPPDQMHDAMHGDHVAARIERRQSGRDGRSRAEGRIVRVLNRAHPTVVGLFRYGSSGNSVLPYEMRLTQEVVIPPGEELTPELRAKLGLPATKAGRVGQRLRELDGAVVQVELTRFPRGGVAPAGRVVEVLGRPGDLGVDIEIMIRKHHLPHKFPEEVLEEARQVARPVSDADREGRRDFRDLPIVTIDGETARDFDDAVYVERRADGGWRLQVHIADVANYVAPGSALDAEARLRGNSVYFPDRAVPMLPEELSNGICSLKPHEDRLVMSALLELDSAGEVTGAEFMPGVIRSAERMTYTNVNRVLEGDSEMSQRYAALAGHFRDMRDLALLLNGQRRRRGSIDFDLPEPVLLFDEKGQMSNIVRSERNIAHRLIEEFMLAANRAVARFLEERGLDSLHRVHEKPDPKKVLEFEQLALASGYSLGVPGISERRVEVKHGRASSSKRGRYGWTARERPMVVTLPGAREFAIRPQHYQRLAEKIAGKPEERIVSYLMLRSLKQARYTADSLGHFALSFDHYTHFTSPIRRYPDLIIHRLLKFALAHRGPSGAGMAEGEQARGQRALAMGRQYPRGALESIALETSDSERRADSAERELVDWKRAQYMEQHLGEEYDALIISVQKFGFFVELMEVFVEGLVPMQRLEEDAGEQCMYRDRDHAIVCGRGPRARLWRLGARLRVRVDRVDPMRRRVEFSLADSE